MTDLPVFLLARIAEDEEAARTSATVYPPPWQVSDRGWVAYVKADAPHFREVARLDQRSLAREDQPEWLGDALAHIARWDPARVLAECDTKRRIVQVHARVKNDLDMDDPDALLGCRTCDYDVDCQEVMGNDEPGCTTLRLLALPYADHGAYREEWKL